MKELLFESAQDTIVIPINSKAKERRAMDDDSIGITNDLPLVLKLFRGKGLQTPDACFVSWTRGELAATLAEYVHTPPLYLHRCRKSAKRN